MRQVALVVGLFGLVFLLSACGSGQDPLQVVTAYYEADSVDKALSYMADDVLVVVDSGRAGGLFPFDGRYEGKAAVREYLVASAKAEADGGLKIERGEMSASGDEVRVGLKIRWIGQLVRSEGAPELFVVKNGKIAYMGPEAARP